MEAEDQRREAPAQGHSASHRSRATLLSPKPGVRLGELKAFPETRGVSPLGKGQRGGRFQAANLVGPDTGTPSSPYMLPIIYSGAFSKACLGQIQGKAFSCLPPEEQPAVLAACEKFSGFPQLAQEQDQVGHRSFLLVS